MPFLLFPRPGPVGAPVDVEEPTLGDGECGRMLEDGSGLRLLEDGSGLRLLESCVPAGRSRTGRLLPPWPPRRERRRAPSHVRVSYGKVPEIRYAESAVGTIRLTGFSTDTWSRLPNLTGWSTDELMSEDDELLEILFLADLL